MARVNRMRWSAHPQGLQTRAIADHAFVAAVQDRGIPEHHSIVNEDMPATYSGNPPAYWWHLIRNRMTAFVIYTHAPLGQIFPFYSPPGLVY